VVRRRLRFLLQEIDLAPGDTVIGRSAACHVTIEDPLISRSHARIRLRGERATVEDLASRNGTLVNGTRIEGEHELKDGDRIRVGTLELVFCVAVDASREAAPTRRDTARMARCPDCGNTYAAELDQCPACGHQAVASEETITGVTNSSEIWSLELAAAVLERARSLGRWDDVLRMLHRGRPTVERLVASGERVDRGQLDIIAECAASYAVERSSAEWASWVLTIHATLSLVPTARVTEQLERVARQAPGALAAAARRLTTNVQASGGPGRDDRGVLARIERLGRG
jgi:hypothetical protein